MFKTLETKTYQTRWYHDNCGGEYLPTGEALMSNPPQYLHLCTKCGSKSSDKKRYPVRTTAEIET